MNIKEYSERMGYKAECEYIEFHCAERVYMATTLDKDEFCEDYKKHKDSEIITDLIKRVEVLEVTEKRKENERKATSEKLLEMMKSLVMYGEDDKMIKEVIGVVESIVGKKEILKFKIGSNLPLTEDEKDEILSKL